MMYFTMLGLDSAPDEMEAIAAFRQQIARVRDLIRLLRRETATMRDEAAALRADLLAGHPKPRARPHYLMIVPDPRPHTPCHQEFGRWEPLPSPHRA